jgi:NAD(P)-dependent dehydrogenase (short-subunit alcohol dehydrogenase family)
MSKVWFITGVSAGLGQALAAAALGRGDRVFGTIRTEEAKSAFEALSPERARGFILDVTDEAAVHAAAKAIEAEAGVIDILVNNAGYGLIGAIEEASLAEIRAQFDVNVLGPITAIQAVLPGMRARRAGRIINITSVSGLAPWAGSGVYGASKFALECIGGALADEVAEFGIKVVNVAPGGLRTKFAGSSMRVTQTAIGDYEGAGHLPQRVFAANTGHEGGDPAKAAAAILKIADAPAPPLNLLLGADAIHYATRRQAQLLNEIGEWVQTSVSIAYDA